MGWWGLQPWRLHPGVWNVCGPIPWQKSCCVATHSIDPCKPPNWHKNTSLPFVQGHSVTQICFEHSLRFLDKGSHKKFLGIYICYETAQILSMQSWLVKNQTIALGCSSMVHQTFFWSALSFCHCNCVILLVLLSLLLPLIQASSSSNKL